MHLAEALLQGPHRAIGIGHALNGCHIGALGLHGEHGAGFYRLAIEVHRTGAAMGGLATDVGSGQGEIFAQEMNQQGARLAQAFHFLAVDLEFDVDF